MHSPPETPRADLDFSEESALLQAASVILRSLAETELPSRDKQDVLLEHTKQNQGKEKENTNNNNGANNKHV